jgi:hypothetical protein
MNALTFHDASGRCASSTPALQEPTCQILLLLYPTCTSTFHAKSIDADPSAEDGTIFLLLLLLSSPSLSQTYTCKRSSSAFSNTFFFVILRGAKLRMVGHGLPLTCVFLQLEDIPVVA